MEGFYRTLRVGLIYQTTYHAGQKTQRDIFEYIEIFYNGGRLHSFIKGDHHSRELF